MIWQSQACRRRESRLFWSIWTIPSLLGTTLMGRQRWNNGYMTFRMRAFALSWSQIILRNASNEQLRNLGLITFIGPWSPSHLGLTVPWRNFTMRKVKWSWSAISSWQIYEQPTVQAFAQSWSSPWSNTIPSKRRLTELVSVVWCEKSLNSTDRLHIKKEFNYGRNSLYWLWSNHSDDR